MPDDRVDAPVGFLVVDKPAGLSSRAVTNRLHGAVARSLGVTRRWLKVGHVGTLDPMATGVLAVAVGTATRLSDVLHELPKSYTATFAWGLESDTEDTTGTVRRVDSPQHDLQSLRGELTAALPNFLGTIRQRPPAYSAKKVDGKRAYDLARRQRAVVLEPVDVRIDALELLSTAMADAGEAGADVRSPSSDSLRFTLRIDCGSGTYIRSLGRDLAAAAGGSAIMSQLTRTRSGPFHLADSSSLAKAEADPLGVLTRPRAALAGLVREHSVTADEASRARNGQALATQVEWQPSATDESQPDGIGDDERHLPIAPSSPLGDRIALIHADDLVALAQPDGRTLRPKLVFPRKTLPRRR